MLCTSWYMQLIPDMADAAIQTSYEACDGRDGKLKEALLGLINITNENQTRLQQLRGEHDTLRWVVEPLHMLSTLLALVILNLGRER